MAAVTQQVPTFLGGVSRQQDTKKTPGQMTEILNGFPDPAFGLIKRNGNQFLTEFTPPAASPSAFILQLASPDEYLDSMLNSSLQSRLFSLIEAG